MERTRHQENGPDASRPLPALSSAPIASDSILLAQIISPPRQPAFIGRLDQYDLVRLIGAGGMGLVFLALNSEGGSRPGGAVAEGETTGPAGQFHQADAPEGAVRSDRTSRVVAVKLIKPELSCNAYARKHFQREIKHLRRLQHPNIVPILDASESPSSSYFVMPYYSAGSLADRIYSGTPLAEDEILRVAIEVAGALAFAHAKGVVHGDLKPANVLLTESGSAILTDFGVARTVFNASLWEESQAGAHPGTAPYMSPSLAEGRPEDTRCDIYSFGALLYEMLAGTPPYSGAGSEEILAQVRAGPPIPIRKRNPEAPARLVRIVERAMARRLRDRYAQMDDVRDELARAAGAQRPIAIADGWLTNAIARFGGKSRAIVALTVAAGLLFGTASILKYFDSNDTPPNQTHGREQPRSASAPSLELERKLSFPDIHRWQTARLVNWTGVGRRDIVVFEDQKTRVFTPEGEILAAGGFAEGAAETLDLLHDIDGDARDEMFFSWRKDSRLFLSVLNQNFFELKRFSTEGIAFDRRFGSEEYYEHKLTPFVVADLDGDGHREIICAIFTGRLLRPRAICSFDLDSGRLNWKNEVATALISIRCADLTGDGRMEIVAGGAGVDNGARLDDGTADSHSYVYVWNADGSLAWRRELLGPSSYPEVAVEDLEGDGKPDVVVRVTVTHQFVNSTGLKEAGRFVRFDPDGNQVAVYDTGSFLLSWQWVDLDGDRRKELLATDRHGALHALNSDLSLRKTVRAVSSDRDVIYLHVAGVADLDGDQSPEIVLSSVEEKWISMRNSGDERLPPNIRDRYNRSVWVLDSSLGERTRFVISENVRTQSTLTVKLIPTLDSPEQFGLLCLTDSAFTLRYRAAAMASAARDDSK